MRDRQWMVGELARATGLTVRALRHYDEIGLLKPHRRTDGGYRVYGQADFDRLSLIALLRRIGLPLRQIKRALDGEASRIEEVVRQYLPEVEQRIELGVQLRQRLFHLLASLEDGDRSGRSPQTIPAAADLATLVRGELRLGAVYSLTGQGAVYGLPSRNGVLLAEDVINRAGGVNGTRVTIEISDDASDRGQATKQTRSLILEREVLALIGPGLTNSAPGAHPVAQALRTPMITTCNPGLQVVGWASPYPCDFIFRVNPREDAVLMACMEAYADRPRVDLSKPSTGIVMYANDDRNSSDGALVVAGNAISHGILLTDTIEFSKHSDDLRSHIARAVRERPEVAFISACGDIPARIMVEARRQGFRGQFIGGHGFNPIAVARQAGWAGRGAWSASSWHIGAGYRANRQFVAAYRERFGGDPDQFGAQAFAGALLLIDAASRAGLTGTDLAGDRIRLRGALEGTRVDTPLGRIRFTSQREAQLPIRVVAIDGRGGHQPVRGAGAVT